MLYLVKRDHWICHRDMLLNRIQQKIAPRSKKVPVRTGAGISKMPGIILLNIPCRIPRIKR
jgi:hypothetical protein